MGFTDLDNFVLGMPYYRYTPNFDLIATISHLNIPLQRQILVGCSDVRFSRNEVVKEFLTNQNYQFSDILLFCDQDTQPGPEDFHNLVINCTEATPMIGSNMLYRGMKEHNWYLFHDPHSLKKQEILNDWTKANSIIEVQYCGFGLVALHRTLLEEMANKAGMTYQSGGYRPDLFSEYRCKDQEIPWEIAKHSFKVKLKPAKISEGQWEELWTETVEELAKDKYDNSGKIHVLPETYSFCSRVTELGKKIYINLGIRPGHLDQIALRAENPPYKPRIEVDNPIIFGQDDKYSSEYRLHA